MQYVRESRAFAVKQMAGENYAEDGPQKPVPVNLLSLYCRTVAPSLIAKNPRVMLSTFERAAKPVVSAMNSWANDEIVRMNLGGIIQRVVYDALITSGQVKVALATPSDAAMKGWSLGAGEPFVERIDQDDFVYDMRARSVEEFSFAGHRYRVPLDTIRDSNIYEKERKDLVPSEHSDHNAGGDDRVSSISSGALNSKEELEDMVDLWEIYVPRHRLVFTFVDDGCGGPETVGENKALRVQNWIGPYCGPYPILSYGIVQGNIVPKGPLLDLVDLHMFANQTFRKLMRQTNDYKKQTAVSGGATEDAKRMQDGSDGQIIAVNQPEQIKNVESGGPSQQLYAMFMETKNLFTYIAGNLDMMGGLGPQSKTATQDKMLEANASRGIADMQDRTVTYTAEVVKSLCWYWHHNPSKVMETTHVVPGFPEFSAPRRVTPQQRQQIPWDKLKIKVDPYSLQHSTPQTRMQGMMLILKELYLPFAALAERQGMTLNLSKTFSKAGEYIDQPDLVELISNREPPVPTTASSSPEQPGMPGSTTRNYVRESMPGRTQKGDEMNRINTMMGTNAGGSPESNGQAGGWK